MKNKFSLFYQLNKNLKTINDIDNTIKISLGPTGKNGITSNEKGKIKIITNGSLLIKALDFNNRNSNIILKLLEQASSKTALISGDGSTTTIMIAC